MAWRATVRLKMFRNAVIKRARNRNHFHRGTFNWCRFHGSVLHTTFDAISKFPWIQTFYRLLLSAIKDKIFVAAGSQIYVDSKRFANEYERWKATRLSSTDSVCVKCSSMSNVESSIGDANCMGRWKRRLESIDVRARWTRQVYWQWLHFMFVRIWIELTSIDVQYVAVIGTRDSSFFSIFGVYFMPICSASSCCTANKQYVYKQE